MISSNYFHQPLSVAKGEYVSIRAISVIPNRSNKNLKASTIFRFPDLRILWENGMFLQHLRDKAYFLLSDVVTGVIATLRSFAGISKTIRRHAVNTWCDLVV